MLKISLSNNEVVNRYIHDNKKTSTIGSNAVYSFLEDDNILWVGTFSTGLNYSTPRIFNVYEYKDFSTLNNRIRSFYYNGKEKLLGTRDGFIYISEEKGIVKEFHSREQGAQWLTSNIITSIAPYNNKYLVCTLDGLSLFNPATLTFSQLPDPLFHTGGFYHFAIDEQKNTWMATFKGVICLTRDGKFTQYTTGNSSLIDNLIHSIEIDSNGRVWIGTKSGVCYWDPDSEEFKTVDILPSSINHCKITHILEDSNSDIWFCTETNGLYTVNNQLSHYEHYTTLNKSLPDNAVTGIVEYELGYYWVATHKGLFRSTFTSNKSQIFWLSDGLPGLTFNPGACYYEKENKRIWWGNENGLVYCDFADVNAHTTLPPVRLTRFYINGKEVVPGESPLDDAINQIKRIKLSWFQKSFGFSFITLDYIFPYDNIFEVMLEGYDKDWQTLDRGQTMISYGNIPAGKYLFRIRLLSSPETEK